MRRPFLAALAAVASLLFLGAIAAAFGHSPRELVVVLVEGALGSPFALQGSLLKTVPLLLTGLAVVIAFRGGVWNIGAEGQFIVGALAAFVCARGGIVIALVAGMIAGAAWASIAIALRIWRNAPEVLTTILLNFIAIHLLGWCVNGPLQESSGKYPQSEATIALPLLGTSDVHAGLLVAVAAAIASWILLYRTTTGLRIRATGLNASAARWAGVDVRRQLILSMAVSGSMAGLAGAIELFGVTHRLFERFAAGYGYSGIAVALLAQLHPLATIASAAFFGALVTGAGELQRTSGVPSSLATLGQALIILVMIISGSFRQHD
ncbi:MAG: ABC transporter permease [Acidobacteriota bacterium]